MRAQRLLRLLSVLIAVLTALAIGGTTAATASSGNTQGMAAAAPPRDDSSDDPVYFLKGYLGASSDATGTDCMDSWQPADTLFDEENWTGPRHFVGYYSGDTNCNTRLLDGGTKNTSLKELGRLLAWDIYRAYSQVGQSVDLVSHSMGGLIAQAAITGVERNEPGWPPYIYVEDAVSIAGPHAGTAFAYACNIFEPTTQCREMRPGSDFLDWTGENPQSAQGTDWTVIGAEADWKINRSALGMSADHRVWYPETDATKGWTHENLNEITTGVYPQWYQNMPERPENDRTGAAPARVAMNALYWCEKW